MSANVVAPEKVQLDVPESPEPRLAHPNRLVSFRRNKSSISTAAFKGRVGARLAQLDANGDGLLDADELVSTVEQLINSEHDRKWLTWVLIACVIMFLCLVGAIGGLTYGIINASKDSRVVDGNLLVSRESGEVVMTAVAREVQISAERLFALDFPGLAGIRTYTLTGSQGSLSLPLTSVSRNASTIVLSSHKGDIVFTEVRGASGAATYTMQAVEHPGSATGLLATLESIGERLLAGGPRTRALLNFFSVNTTVTTTCCRIVMGRCSSSCACCSL